MKKSDTSWAKFKILTCYTCLSIILHICTALPPNIPDPNVSKKQLAELTIRPRRENCNPYNRTLFPHWINIQGACNTREIVMQRDGSNVQTRRDNCAIISGVWYSTYDGASWNRPQQLDIDHVVPLADAWKSGACYWKNETRTRFANDLYNPQLIAVTESVNKNKGSKSPDRWKPPLMSFWCTYARAWIQVKSAYNLSVTDKEHFSLEDMLKSCPHTKISRNTAIFSSHNNVRRYFPLCLVISLFFPLVLLSIA